jgi:hypothetical protein
MRTENGVEIDFEALDKILRTGDVITIGFSLFPERILVDTRSNDRQGQLAAVVEPVGSVQERYRWLGRRRASFGAPEAFSFFVWPQTVNGFIERNILRVLRERMDVEALEQLDVALADAAWREREAMAAAVRGDDSWPSIWESSAG